MTRRKWVVVVKGNDDHPGAVRLSGPFVSRDLAQAIVDKVQAACSDLEESGFAWLVELEKFGSREAVGYALGRSA